MFHNVWVLLQCKASNITACSLLYNTVQMYWSQADRRALPFVHQGVVLWYSTPWFPIGEERDSMMVGEF